MQKRRTARERGERERWKKGEERSGREKKGKGCRKINRDMIQKYFRKQKERRNVRDNSKRKGGRNKTRIEEERSKKDG